MAAALQVHPDRPTFDRIAADWPLVPVWAELLADVGTPVGLLPAIAGDGPGLLLESVERSERWGRYSFVAGDPAAILVADDAGVRLRDVVRDLPIGEPSQRLSPREALRAAVNGLKAPRLDGLPPITGGLMGYASYEAAVAARRTSRAACRTRRRVPPVGLLLIDRAVVFDHWRQRLVLVVHAPRGGYDDGRRGARGARRQGRRRRRRCRCSAAGESSDVTGEPNMADEAYRDIVASFKEHILAGDIFQGVPSRRVVVPRARTAACPSTGGCACRTRPRTCSSCGCSAWSSPARRPSRWCGSRAGGC